MRVNISPPSDEGSTLSEDDARRDGPLGSEFTRKGGISTSDLNLGRLGLGSGAPRRCMRACPFWLWSVPLLLVDLRTSPESLVKQILNACELMERIVTGTKAWNYDLPFARCFLLGR